MLKGKQILINETVSQFSAYVLVEDTFKCMISKVPLCVDQAAGANNFKKPNPIDQNNAEREKNFSGPDPKQTDPKQTDRIPPNKSE